MKPLLTQPLRALRARRRELGTRAFEWGWSRAPRLFGAAELAIDVASRRVRCWRGQLPTANGALEVSYVGHNRPYLTWLTRALSGRCGRTAPGPWRRPRLAATPAHDLDLSVVELPVQQAASFARHGWLIIPTAINHLQSLTGVNAGQTAHERRLGHRLRRSGLEVRFSRSTEDLRFFYDRVYLPTVRQRQGPAGFVRDFDYFRRKLDGGWLLLTEREGVVIAGLFIEPRPGSPEVLALVCSGVRDGDYDATREFERLASFATVINWARHNGFVDVQWGPTLPLLDDGLMRHKLRFGTRLELVPTFRFHLAVRFERDGPALRAFLAAHPFFAVSAAGPVGIRGDAVAHLREWPPGLAACYVSREDDPVGAERPLPDGDRAAALRRLAAQLGVPR